MKITGRLPKVRWEEMFPEEFVKILAEMPVCYMPYGLAEPHGAYNALGLDWLKADALCVKAAETHGGIVAPPFCWHIQERPEFNWLESMGVTGDSMASSIPSDLFYRIVLHQIRAFDARGFHVAILISGHHGMEKDLRLLREFYEISTRTPMKICTMGDWECIEYGRYGADHAGMCETQQLMALHPSLVDLSLSEPSPVAGPMAGTRFDAGGKIPTAETGARIVNSQIRRLGIIRQELLENYTPDKDYASPDQAEADTLWHTFKNLTRKYWVTSRTLGEFNRGAFVEFPGWEALGLNSRQSEV